MRLPGCGDASAQRPLCRSILKRGMDRRSVETAWENRGGMVAARSNVRLPPLDFIRSVLEVIQTECAFNL